MPTRVTHHDTTEWDAERANTQSHPTHDAAADPADARKTISQVLWSLLTWRDSDALTSAPTQQPDSFISISGLRSLAIELCVCW